MKLAVMMSTYNGEKYLREQLDSILSQKLASDVDMTIYIRDDGSSDSTPCILKEYQSRSVMIDLVQMGGSNYGCLKSFLLLLQYAFNQGNDYFAFSDQDDVWLPDKLQTGINAIKGSKNPKGALYFSNKTFVDGDLKFLEDEKIVYYNDFIEIIWTSQSSGCTQVFNRALAELAASHIPTLDKCLHDAWVYRTAKTIGSDVVFDSKSYIKYRIHGNNTMGYSGLRLYGSLGHLTKGFIKSLFGKRAHFQQKFIREIVSTFPNDIPDKNKKYVNALLNYDRRYKDKGLLLHAPEMKKRPFKMRVIWHLKVLTEVY